MSLLEIFPFITILQHFMDEMTTMNEKRQLKQTGMNGNICQIQISFCLN